MRTRMLARASALRTYLTTYGPLDVSRWDLAYALHGSYPTMGWNAQTLDIVNRMVREESFTSVHGWTVPPQSPGPGRKSWQVIDVRNPPTATELTDNKAMYLAWVAMLEGMTRRGRAGILVLMNAAGPTSAVGRELGRGLVQMDAARASLQGAAAHL